MFGKLRWWWTKWRTCDGVRARLKDVLPGRALQAFWEPNVGTGGAQRTEKRGINWVREREQHSSFCFALFFLLLFSFLLFSSLHPSSSVRSSVRPSVGRRLDRERGGERERGWCCLVYYTYSIVQWSRVDINIDSGGGGGGGGGGSSCLLLYFINLFHFFFFKLTISLFHFTEIQIVSAKMWID